MTIMLQKVFYILATSSSILTLLFWASNIIICILLKFIFFQNHSFHVAIIQRITYLELVTFSKTDIVIFVTLLSQPSTVVGNFNGFGRGWPKTIQNKNENAVRTPAITPPSVVDSVPIPSVKIPNNGPLATPIIVNAVYDKKNLFYRFCRNSIP